MTKDDNDIIVWKKEEKKNNYIKYLTINDAYYCFFIINSNLFCFQDDNYNLKFYDTHSYQCNKVINYYKIKVQPIGIIKEESILFITNLGNMALINIKVLEIVQIIGNNYLRKPILCNNSLFNVEIKLKKNKIKITQRKFNDKEGCFDKEKTLTSIKLLGKHNSLNLNLFLIMIKYFLLIIFNFMNLLIIFYLFFMKLFHLLHHSLNHQHLC